MEIMLLLSRKLKFQVGQYRLGEVVEVLNDLPSTTGKARYHHVGRLTSKVYDVDDADRCSSGMIMRKDGRREYASNGQRGIYMFLLDSSTRRV